MTKRAKSSCVYLTALAMLIALQVVLSRFLSIETQTLKIGFGFVPVMVAGALFGPAGGMIVGGLSDLVGALLSPMGPYFFGYTATAAFSGAVYGLFFSKNPTMLRMVIAYAITTLVVTLGFNTLFVAVLYIKTESSLLVKYLSLLPSRLLQAGVMLVVQVLLTDAILVRARLVHKVKAVIRQM